MNWICHKCSYSVEIKNLSQIEFCPNCWTKCDDASQSQCEKKCESDVSNKNDSQRLTPAICPICCCEITADDQSIACIDCKTRYHEECWNDNNGCATYGCKSAKNIDVHTQPDNTPPKVPCPWCHTLLLPKTVICSSCGKRTDLTSNSNDGLSIEKFSASVLIPIKNNLLILWKDAEKTWDKIRPLLVSVLRSYKETISKYTQFDGEASRKEFCAFALISLIVYALLIFVPENCYLAVIYLFATIIPTMALFVRRLHNTGLSGWFVFAIPVLPLLLLVPENNKLDTMSDERK